MSTEWMGEMLLKGVTRLKREKVFLASRRGLSMGTNWTTSGRSRISVQECRARGMKNPGKNVSVVNLDLRVHKFIARMQTADNGKHRDPSGTGLEEPSRSGNKGHANGAHVEKEI